MTLKSQKQLYQFLESIICGEDVKTKEEMSMDDDIVTSEYDSKISEYADFIDDVEEVTVDECFMDDINNDNLYLQDHRSSEAVKDNIINIDDTDTAVIFTLGVNSTENEFQLLSPDKVYVCDETDTEMISGINYDCSNDDQFGMNRNDRKTNVFPKILNDNTDESSATAFPCYKCELVFDEKNRLFIHIEKMHNYLDSDNDGCRKVNYLKDEWNVSSGINSSRSSEEASKQRPGSATEADVSGYYCDSCTYSSRFKRMIKIHVLSHLGLSLFRCDECGKGFNDRLNLTVHQNNHRGVKPFRCDVCGNSYTRLHYMRKHRRIKHEPGLTGSGPKFVCHVCKKRFSFSQSLKIHLKWHTGQNRISCDVCSKTVSSKESLEHHRRVFHLRLRPFRCDTCDKSFASKWTLRDHCVVHVSTNSSDGRSFMCDMCGKSFVTSKRLSKHVKIHSQTRTVYSCDFCAKKYFSKYKLMPHITKYHRTAAGKEPSKAE